MSILLGAKLYVRGEVCSNTHPFPGFSDFSVRATGVFGPDHLPDLELFDTRSGQTFKRESFLGKGKYGIVFKYVSGSTQEAVAVKIIPRKNESLSIISKELFIAKTLEDSPCNVVKARVISEGTLPWDGSATDPEDVLQRVALVLMPPARGTLEDIQKLILRNDGRKESRAENILTALQVCMDVSKVLTCLCKMNLYFTDMKLSNWLYNKSRNCYTFDISAADISSIAEEDEKDFIITYRAPWIRTPVEASIFGIAIIFMQLVVHPLEFSKQFAFIPYSRDTTPSLSNIFVRTVENNAKTDNVRNFNANSFLTLLLDPGKLLSQCDSNAEALLKASTHIEKTFAEVRAGNNLGLGHMFRRLISKS